MRERTGSGNGTGVGMASVLVIVMVLALTTFGILALTSARTEERQSARLQEITAAYYDAEERLEGQLADLDAELLLGTAELPADGVWELKEDVREGQKLLLTVKDGEGGEKGRYEILAGKLVNESEWNPGNDLKVWDGTDRR